MTVCAKIASGDDFVTLPFAHWATEVRVEQTLSKPTKFAVRFADDLCEGNFEVAGQPEIGANKLIAIFVTVNKVNECLVIGPITKVRSASMLGGPGSWVEIHGEDLRVKMDRVAVTASYAGLASDAAESILAAHSFDKKVEPTTIPYDEKDRKLSQRASDLAFLQDIARKNNFEFWLDYKVSEIAGIDAITCTPFANMMTSPPGPWLVGGPPILIADTKKAVKVQPPPGECATVTKFDVRIDFERPNAAHGFAQPIDGKDAIENAGTATQETVNAEAEPVVQIDGIKRTRTEEPKTDPDEQLLAQSAALTEAAWFVEVDCSTTLDLIHFLVQPHQIVDVQYATPGLSGAYQVMSTTHVITAADHFIDFKLRANGLPPAKAA